MSPEAKKKAAEAKSRGDDAFNTKDFHTAVDAYTQVDLHIWAVFSEVMRGFAETECMTDVTGLLIQGEFCRPSTWIQLMVRYFPTEVFAGYG